MPAMRGSRSARLVALAGLVSACAAPTAPSAPPSVAVAVAHEPALPEGCRPPRPELAAARLEAPGSEPRRPLRYDAAAASLRAALRLVVREDARRWQVELEPLGRACFRYRALEQPQAARPRSRPPFGVLTARPLGEVWTQRGFHPNDDSVDGAQRMDEYVLELRHDVAMDAIWLPLPEAPVGIGARWSATRRSGRGGPEFDEEHLFTLEHDDGDRIVVATEIVEDGSRERAHSAAIELTTPDGHAVRVYEPTEETLRVLIEALLHRRGGA